MFSSQKMIAYMVLNIMVTFQEIVNLEKDMVISVKYVPCQNDFYFSAYST